MCIPKLLNNVSRWISLKFPRIQWTCMASHPQYSLQWCEICWRTDTIVKTMLPKTYRQRPELHASINHPNRNGRRRISKTMTWWSLVNPPSSLLLSDCSNPLQSAIHLFQHHSFEPCSAWNEASEDLEGLKLKILTGNFWHAILFMAFYCNYMYDTYTPCVFFWFFWSFLIFLGFFSNHIALREIYQHQVGFVHSYLRKTNDPTGAFIFFCFFCWEVFTGDSFDSQRSNCWCSFFSFSTRGWWGGWNDQECWCNVLIIFPRKATNFSENCQD